MSNLALKPYVVADWRNEDFAGWSLPDPLALWTLSPFSSLAKGRNTLWHHTAGTGTFPNQSVDPDFVGTRDVDLVDSPQVDLSPFTSSSFRFRVTTWFRPEHVAPSLSGEDQEAPRVELFAVTGDGATHFVGRLDSPILDPDGVTVSKELSRVGGDAGNANVGVDGKWWFSQVCTPVREVQDAVLGDALVSLRLALHCGQRDATGYGTGVERVCLDILRGGQDDASAEFAVNLHRSYINSRRWI